MFCCTVGNAADDKAVEIEVIRKLSEDQCSGSRFSDVTVEEAAYVAASDRQLTVTHLQRQSGQARESGQGRHSGDARHSSQVRHSAQARYSSQVRYLPSKVMFMNS